MAAVTICSDFGAKENKACHCFHCFCIYLPWSDGTKVIQFYMYLYMCVFQYIHAYTYIYTHIWSFPGITSGKEPAFQCRRLKRHGFNPLGQEDPLEEGLTIHSSILAWRILWTEEPGEEQPAGLQRVGYNWVMNTDWLIDTQIYNINMYTTQYI